MQTTEPTLPERPQATPSPGLAAVGLSPAERAAVEGLLAMARRALRGELLEVRLYGSRARGEGHEGSDVDLAFIVTQAGRARRREIHDLAYDIGLEHGIDLAPLVIERSRLDRLGAHGRAFAANLERDGVVL